MRAPGLSVTHAPSLLAGILLVGALLGGGRALSAAPQDASSTFRHLQHQDVQCQACHGMDPAHGTSLIQSVEDCRSCHHPRPPVRECTACHVDVEVQEQVFTLTRTFSLSVDEAPTERELPFSHLPHRELGCTRCHERGPSLAVPNLRCENCHAAHHAESVSVSGCLSCHQEPPSEAHELVVHSTCAGSGCHEDVPVRSAPRTRTGCLWCHQEQSEHEPELECVSCHVMPPPRPFER
jgi:hypothetical protein